MNNDPQSLDNLRDIVFPAPPPFWPPAPGLWLMLGVVISILFLIAWHRYSARKFNAYRRAGIALLADTYTVHDVSVVLKRVALAVFPREQVASLYGKDWVDFLNGTCPQSGLSEITATDSGVAASQELLDRAGDWIRRHRAPDPRPAHSEP